MDPQSLLLLWTARLLALGLSAYILKKEGVRLRREAASVVFKKNFAEIITGVTLPLVTFLVPASTVSPASFAPADLPPVLPPTVRDTAQPCQPLWISVFYDRTGSMKLIAVRDAEIASLRPLVLALERCGGVLSFDVIGGGTGPAPARLSLVAPPPPVDTAGARDGPITPAKGEANVRHLMEADSASWTAWRDTVIARTNAFWHHAGLVMSEKVNAKSSPVCAAVLQSQSFFAAESQSDTTRRWALLVTDGVDNIPRVEHPCRPAETPATFIQVLGNTKEKRSLQHVVSRIYASVRDAAVAVCLDATKGDRRCSTV